MDSTRNSLKDHEVLPAWLREAADEIEKAHRVLDNWSVERGYISVLGGGGYVSYTLAARIELLGRRND